MAPRYWLPPDPDLYFACEVTLNVQDCEHPPGASGDGLPSIQSRCYRCGQRACKRCSALELSRVRNGRRRWIRVCRDCSA